MVGVVGGGGGGGGEEEEDERKREWGKEGCQDETINSEQIKFDKGVRMTESAPKKDTKR